MTLDELLEFATLTSKGCLLWGGPFNGKGYGIVQRGTKQVLVHRLAMELRRGAPIPKGVVVRHKVCDNPPCCNPEHLALGSHQDNMRDRRGKGRPVVDARRALNQLLCPPKRGSIFPRPLSFQTIPAFQVPSEMLLEIERRDLGHPNPNVVLVWLAQHGLHRLDELADAEKKSKR